jgi:hypothetical protein
MTPRARRLLRWATILAFLILAPAIILSTAGYRYNFAKRRLERTGTLFIGTVPQGARVTVNGRALKDETPVSAAHLTPGRYVVRIAKAGFREWAETVDVRSAVTAFFDDVVLFKEALPEPIFDLGISASAFSPDGRMLAALVVGAAGAEVRVLDLKSRIAHLPYRAAAVEDSTYAFSWAADGKRLLLRRQGGEPAFLLWDSSAPEGMTDIATLLPSGAADAFWDQGGGTLYAAAEGTLYALDFNLELALPSGPAADAGLVAEGALYGLAEGDGTTAIVRRGLKETGFETLAELPAGSYRRLEGRGRKLGYAAASGKLYLFDPDPGLAREGVAELSAADGVWSSSGRKLLAWNELELSSYESEKGSADLLTRVGGSLRKAAWHPSERVALFAVGGAVSAIEIEDRSGRAETPLATFTEIMDFAVTRAGDAAHFVGTIGQRSGVWMLKLR